MSHLQASMPGPGGEESKDQRTANPLHLLTVVLAGIRSFWKP